MGDAPPPVAISAGDVPAEPVGACPPVAPTLRAESRPMQAARASRETRPTRAPRGRRSAVCRERASERVARFMARTALTWKAPVGVRLSRCTRFQRPRTLERSGQVDPYTSENDAKRNSGVTQSELARCRRSERRRLRERGFAGAQIRTSRADARPRALAAGACNPAAWQAREPDHTCNSIAIVVAGDQRRRIRAEHRTRIVSFACRVAAIATRMQKQPGAVDGADPPSTPSPSALPPQRYYRK
jgi:hypothetical protein